MHRPLLLLGLWLALVTGLLEAAWIGAGWVLLDQEIGLSPAVLWMAPTVHAAVFALLASGLALVARRRPDRPWLRIGAFAFVGIGALSLLLLYRRLHWLAVPIFALGLAVRLSSVIAARPDRWLGLARRTVAPMAALVLLLAAGLSARARWTERRALAALPAAQPGMPNVLLLILDTVRARSLSLYGYGRPTTPNLERLAARGVVFDWAIAPSPWTLPSHASMFTGRWPHEMSTSWRVPLDATDPTLAERLSARGYRTGGFVANLYYCGWEFGLDRGFAHYEDYTRLGSELALGTSLGRRLSMVGTLRRVVGWYDNVGRKSAAEINADFLDWAAEDPARPFFAFLNYYDAHEPYLPPAPYDTAFGPTRPRDLHLLDRLEMRNGIRWARARMPAAEQAAERNAYDGAIAYLDAQIGALADSLAARGLLERTVIVVTADHGESLGEHGIWGHGESLHLPEMHVPLLVVAPGRAPAGVRVRRPVSLRDLGATLHALLGLEAGAFPGASFAAAWSDSAASRPWADTVYAEFDERHERSLIAGRWHYMLDSRGREQLFDLAADPAGTRDLAPADSGRRLRLPLANAVMARLAAMRAAP